MTLRDTTRHILDSDDPAEWLRLADVYIDSYNQMPAAFILPADHAILREVIATFHSNSDAFRQYVKAIRDQFPPGEHRAAIHRLYRTLVTRVIQRSRRARRARAIDAVEKALNRPLDPTEKARVADRIEQHWAMRRRAYLKDKRNTTSAGRLSTDVQSDILNEFWAEIDVEIDRGDLPIFKL